MTAFNAPISLYLLLLVPLAISQLPILFLRTPLLGILTDMCGNRFRAEFWVRSAALMSALGSLMLALVFGTDSVRSLIVMSLFGAFSALLFVTNAMWSTMRREQQQNQRSPIAPS